MPAINKIRSILKLKDILKDGLVKTGEPQKSFMFEVEIIDTVNGNSFNNLRYYVKEATIPARSKDPIAISYMNNKINWAGKDSSSKEVNITFWDDEDLTITHFLHDWYYMSGDAKYQDGITKAEYTRDIKIILKPTLDIGSTGAFVFKDCFPTQLGEVSLSYENSDVMEMQTTFSYDYVELQDADGNILKSIVDLYGSVLGTSTAIGDIVRIF